MTGMTITEMMTAAKKLRGGGERFTLLGIGPMSCRLIEAVLEVSKERDFPVLLIASRNQVDSDVFGGGYVAGYNQRRFAEAVKSAERATGFSGLCYLCRDHGGPWQRDEERTAKLDADTAMRRALDSYLEDLESGFDLLHVDPTKDPHCTGVVPLPLVLERTVELIQRIEDERKKRGLAECGYEVGTEETNGGLTSVQAFEDFANKLTKRLLERGLPLPLFIVGQTGTLTRLTENVGHYDTATATALTDASHRCGMGLKEHNGDYLADEILLEHPVIGLDAMNVAPEFGAVETGALITLSAAERKFTPESRCSSLISVMTRSAVRGGRWRKWVRDDLAGATPEQILENAETARQILRICGHYTLAEKPVKEQTAVLAKNLKARGIDLDGYVKKQLRTAIDRYAFCFNQYGLTSKLTGAR